MATQVDLYSWSVNGDTITIVFQGWNDSWWGSLKGTCFLTYTGRKQPDGTIFWLFDDGSIVSEKTEAYLTRTHRQYCLKHGIDN